MIYVIVSMILKCFIQEKVKDTKNGELIQEQIEDLMELLKLKRKEVSL